MDIQNITALGLAAFIGLPLLLSLFNGLTQLRNALIWVLIFFGFMGVSAMWDDIKGEFIPRQATFTEGRIEVPKSLDNHFRLTLFINSVPVEFLVDTGASQIVLTQDDATRVGLHPDTLNFIGTAYTANGPVPTAPVRLDTVTLGDLQDTRLRASVNGGDMETSLLGMSYLSRFKSIEIRRDLLVLNH